MADKSGLYLKIARRSAANGEGCRAIVTIINALRNNPQYLETQPEAVDLLAELLVPGYEDEIHRLETAYPSFSERLSKALVACGKAEFAAKLESSFEAYCIDQLKSYRMQKPS